MQAIDLYKRSLRKYKPKSIVDIGVWNGKRSISLIKQAVKYVDHLYYYGFDMFGDMNDKLRKKEYCPKRTINMARINKLFNMKLHRLINKVSWEFFQGDTKKTLSNFKGSHPIDFVIIDGGHSIKTIRSDWKNALRLTHRKSVIFLDDYYDNVRKMGCKRLIKSLDKNKYNVKLHQVEGGRKVAEVRYA